MAEMWVMDVTGCICAALTDRLRGDGAIGSFDEVVSVSAGPPPTFIARIRHDEEADPPVAPIFGVTDGS